jgi:tetratricopeptide (TPR) repeat protein
MTPEYQRAQLLIQVRRFDEAAETLRRHLLAHPDDAQAHAQLAYCLIERKDYGPATEHAQQAVGLAPDSGFSHHALGFVLLCRNHFPEAHVSADAALRADPHNEDNYRLRAAIRAHQERWSEALADAEAGLAVDPEDTGCLNLRAQCLMRLGRRAEAARSVETALRRHPDNAASHATHGWTLLENGEPDAAMHHFREALRLEPDFGYARQGIVHAMKARHVIYRAFLGYIFWMMRLSPRARWGVVIGGVIGANLVDQLSGQFPAWAPVLQPLFWAYVAFAIMTWLAVPLFSLLLRTSRFGRLALSTDETRGANLLAAALLLVLGLLAAAIATGDVRLWEATIRAGLLLVPVSAVYLLPAGNARIMMALITTGLALLALIRCLNVREVDGETMSNVLGDAAGVLFLLGFVGSQLFANVLINRTVRH